MRRGGEGGGEGEQEEEEEEEEEEDWIVKFKYKFHFTPSPYITWPIQMTAHTAETCRDKHEMQWCQYNAPH